MLDRIAEQVERHQRVDPRWLDASPRAVGLLPVDDEALGLLQRRAPKRGRRPPLVDVQQLVQSPERARPGRERLERLRRRPRPQLVEREPDRADRLERGDDSERRDRLARPAREVVDVERDGGREQHHLRRHHRDVVPRPQPEQREPDLREDARPLEAACVEDVLPCAPHVLGVDRVAGELERRVRLDGGRKVGRCAPEVAPRPVVALLGTDPARRHLRLLLGADAEELAKEEVLRVHGHVRFELAFPPALGRLEREQVVDGPVERRLHGWSGRGGRQNSLSTMKRASPSSSSRAPGSMLARSSSRRASASRRSASSAA